MGCTNLQALLLAMKLASAAKQPWLLSNAAVALWNTYLPNLQQQRVSPLLTLLGAATAQLLSQPDVTPHAVLLYSLATAYASAAEHAALQAVLAAAGQTGPDVEATHADLSGKAHSANGECRSPLELRL